MSSKDCGAEVLAISASRQVAGEDVVACDIDAFGLIDNDPRDFVTVSMVEVREEKDLNG